MQHFECFVIVVVVMVVALSENILKKSTIVCI